MKLDVTGVFETAKGLELTVQAGEKTMTAVIKGDVLSPNENVAVPKPSQFSAMIANEERTLSVVYLGGAQPRVYNAQIKS